MKQNEPYEFTYEPELLKILGDAKVDRIIEYNLERVFDDLYDYYFEYSKDEAKAIQRAYNLIFDFEEEERERIAIEVLAAYIYKHMKEK